MRIHITTIAPEQAAVEIMKQMESHGGQWIVNAVEDEGYVIAKVGTLCGKRLSRSCSPSLCGPFSTNTTLDELRGRVRITHRISKGVKSSCAKREPKPKPDDGWESPTHKAIDMLKDGDLKIADLVETIGISRHSAHSLMRRLIESNRARIVERIPTGRGNATVCTYGIAA